jgi:hypothetical protein
MIRGVPSWSVTSQLIWAAEPPLVKRMVGWKVVLSQYGFPFR